MIIFSKPDITEQYTKDAVKTALKEELKKFISSRGLGEQGATEHNRRK